MRVFRAELGLPPHAYLLRVRTAHAKALLAAGAAVSDAALRAGFAAQTHLHRHFVRTYGTTPGRYARDARSGPSA